MNDADETPLFPPDETDGQFVTVAKIGDIPEGQGRAFEVDGRMIAVFNKDGNYFAIDDFCPHQGASLAEGYIDGCAVACPWHHWRFSIADGTWLDNPRIGVEKFDVRVVNNQIQVQRPSKN